MFVVLRLLGLLFDNWLFFGISAGIVLSGIIAFPLVLIWLFRLQWEKRMRDNRVAFIEVDDRTLRLIKLNGANLVFPRGENPFSILIFQERGMDLFCLEVSCRHHTPRYFFLGKEKEKAETLLRRIGLQSFEPRCPVLNAQKNWEAIPKALNEKLSKQKRSFIKPHWK